VNPQRLADALGVEVEVVERLLATFVATTRQNLAELQQALEQRDSSAAARLAHHIKGAAAGLELEELRLEAENLEQQAREGNLEGVEGCLTRLSAHLQILGSASGGPAVGSPGKELPGDSAAQPDVGEQ
jgi:HPt (histidine-containing phosphotransfer) domain-containing protein